ncbi:unnamed protein product [Mortierella alpina]
MPRLAVATFGPVCTSVSGIRQVEKAWGYRVDSTVPRTPSSDNALIKSGTADMAMAKAFGVVALAQPEYLTVQGRTDGFAFSAKAKLVGFLAVVLSAPHESSHHGGARQSIRA